MLAVLNFDKNVNYLEESFGHTTESKSVSIRKDIRYPWSGEVVCKHCF